MKTKIWMMIGTVAIAITITGSKWIDGAAAEAEMNALRILEQAGIAMQSPQAAQDPYNLVLGVNSDEELYDALYDGQTLADIAADHGKDAQGIINLQIAEMTALLDSRLLSGSISPQVYVAQKAELADIISRSVYGSV